MKRLILIYCTLLLTSCGFHLRGTITGLDWLSPIAIDMQQPDHILNIELQNALQSNNILITTIKPKYRLIIEHHQFNTQLTSVSSSTTPRQYLITYSVQYHLISATGKIIIPSHNTLITRQNTLNNDRILGSETEKHIIEREMIHEIAYRIVHQLTLARHITL